MRKGRKHSEETKQRMREAALRRIAERPHTAPPHVGQKPFLGRSHTDEAKQRIAAAKVGERNPMYGKTGPLSPNWTGDQVGYFGVHDWLTKHFGQPLGCDDCGTDDPDARYEWANISGEYRRDRSDFRRLCKKCHNDMDGVNLWQQVNPRQIPSKKTYRGKPVTSQYKGVTASGYGTWLARCNRKHLGTFKTQEEAALAYNRAAKDAWGYEAYQNEVPE